MTTRMTQRLVPSILLAICAATALQAPSLAQPVNQAPSAAKPASQADDHGPRYITGDPGREAAHDHTSGDGVQQPPLQASKNALQTKPAEKVKPAARPSMTAPKSQRSTAAAAATCNVSDFASRTGSQLVTFIKGSTTDCVNTLFNVQGADAYSIFRESQMTSVAYALRDNSVNYAGNNTTSTAQLVLFLRAGYYVQYYDSGTVGTYGTSLSTAITSALDSFFSNPRSSDVNDANGETLSEAVTLIDSSEQNARYLYVVKRLLNGYNSSYNTSWWMLNAVNNTYTVLFRGHQVPAFVSAVAADRSVLDTLYNFAGSHLDLLGGDQSYLTSNAGRELGRFLGDASIKSTVKPLVAGLLNQSSITGPTAPLWVGLAEMTDSYDKANCSYYGTCDLATRLAASVLPVNYTCSASIKIRAQQMSSAELAASCTSLKNQDAYFHNIARDNGPVANDNNTTIEVVVFDSSTDYQTYAGAMFGIDTNNGGMYLEGNPAAAGNQPRFIAYEAEWVRPTFQIWNLNHEYTHYLDGRFNMYGDFGAGISTPTIWWIEGFAEYISYSYRGEPYTAAQQEAARGTYSLRTLFDTTYSNDTTRIYRWGYLASAFMLNRHPSEMATVLGYYRSGNWAAARTYLTSTIGTRFDAEFRSYLADCAAGSCGGGTPTNQAPTASFTATANGLTVALTDTSRDSDGTIASRRWDFGDGTTSTTANPSKTYSAAGTYTVALTVTDNGGATSTTTKAVTVTGGTGNQAPTASFTATANGLTVALTDTSRDSDGTIASRRWDFGDGTTSTTANPSKTYSAAGTYTVTLTVTDNGGATSTTTKAVTVTGGSTSVRECTDPDTRALGKNCGRSNRAAAAGDDDFLYVYIPSGTTRLVISSTGGAGNSDLYYSATGWASPSNYSARSTAAGNTATLTINNPVAGYHYITLHGQTDFSGVSVSTTF